MRFHSPKRQKSTRDLATTRPLIDARSDGYCDRCGQPLPTLDNGSRHFELHHRQARTQGGGDGAENGLATHPTCHAWIHSHPIEAKDSGWIVPRGQDPATTPVLIAGRWSLLDSTGGVQAVNEVA